MIYKTVPKLFNPRFEVVSCFLECQGEILLVYRLESKSQGNRWGVLAGKMDPGENQLEAMIRETKEECGLLLAPNELDYLTTVYIKFPEYHFVYHMFRARLDKKPQIILSADEHTAFRWTSPQAALKLPLVKDLDRCINLIYPYGRD